MTDTPATTALVTEEMVEKACIAFKAAEEAEEDRYWSELFESAKEEYRCLMRAALEAVAPLIAAQEREACARAACACCRGGFPFDAHGGHLVSCTVGTVGGADAVIHVACNADAIRTRGTKDNG